MNVDTSEFAVLTAEVERLREQLLDLGQAVTDQAAEISRLRRDACTLRTIQEVVAERRGIPPGPAPLLPRRLFSVDGGAGR